MITGALIAVVVLQFLALGLQRTREGRLWHRHDRTEWTGWVQMGRLGEVWWDKVRRCRTCGQTWSQHAGYHRCPDAYSGKKCKHREQFAALLDETNIDTLERELGIHDD